MQKFYGYYKQATVGPCDAPKPAFWDVIGKAKWEAWEKLGEMSSEEAMIAYVDELKKIIETMPHTPMVMDFITKLGDFYELMDDNIGTHYRRLKPLLNANSTEVGVVDSVPDVAFALSSDSEGLQEGCDGAQSKRVDVYSHHRSHDDNNENLDSEEDEFCDTFEIPPAQIISEELLHEHSQQKAISLSTLNLTRETNAHSSIETACSRSNVSSDEQMNKVSTKVNIIDLLENIQEDIKMINTRLKIIEGVMQTHVTTKWWTLRGINKTFMFCILWPFLLHLLYKLLKRYRLCRYTTIE